MEESWKKKSGSLAYRLIKDRPHPPVLEMEVCSSVKLRPQRWPPDGKQWIELLPGHGFQVGDCLSGKIDCEVVEVMDTSIRLDRKVSRTEATSLAKTEVSLDPAVWSHSFFAGWNEFWQRESDFDDTCPWKDLLERIPGKAEQFLSPVSFADWRAALAKAKVATMRGTCGWSVGELRLLPDYSGFLRPLRRVAVGRSSCRLGYLFSCVKKKVYPLGSRLDPSPLLPWSIGFGRGSVLLSCCSCVMSRPC